jgi:hypothetical protein
MAIRDATVVVIVVVVPFAIRAFVVGRERQLKKRTMLLLLSIGV